MAARNSPITKHPGKDLTNGGKNGAGRPSKINKEVLAKLFDLIESGIPVTTACAACRLSFQTIQNWCERGETDGKGEFFEFLEQYKEVRAKALIGPALHLRKAAAIDWRAAAHILKVRDPDNWGERPQFGANMNVQGEQVLIVLPAPATPKEWNKQVANYLANGSGGNHKTDRNS